MISKNVLDMIPKTLKFCAGQPIKKAWLFGSCSRGEETPDSDVDIMVEYDRQNERISLMRIDGMMLSLEDKQVFKISLYKIRLLCICRTFFCAPVLSVYQSLCPHSSIKQKKHLHQNKARQI